MTTEYIATFGDGHVHPASGESLARRFVRLEVPSLVQARAVMFALFGPKWSHVYDSEEAAGVAQYGLRELPIGDLIDRAVAAGRAVWLLHPHRDQGYLLAWRHEASRGQFDEDDAIARAWRIVLDLLAEVDMLREQRVFHEQRFTCNVARATHPEIQATGVTVHVLVGGFAACGFSRELPRDWPTGHKWHEQASGATCAACLDAVNYADEGPLL